MNYSVENLVLTGLILLTGLTAGLCFTWSNTITAGIGRLDDLSFLRAFQEMNRVIINPTFILVFFGPVIGNIVNIYLNNNEKTEALWLFVIAGGLFILGVGFVTVFKNVPLNNILDRTDLLSASGQELKELRSIFEIPWNKWHMVRTVTSILSFVLLLIGLIIRNNHIIKL